VKCLFFDTESTDLDAPWGRILCASFGGLAGEPYTFRGDKRKWKGQTLIDDSKLVTAIRDELETADLIVGWNSILHDIPLLNARLRKVGERDVHARHHLDLMYYAGGQSMKLGSRRLDNVARYFQSPHQKTSLDGDIWQLAATGDKKAMGYIVEHCEADVEVLRDLWPSLAPLVKKIQAPLAAWWGFADQIPARLVGRR
jgi:uncharacterized protein YprB with RNaseH-like and TPR domain